MHRASLALTLALSLTATSSAAAPLATAYGKPVERGDFDAELAGIKAQFKNNPKRSWDEATERRYRTVLLVERLEDALLAEAIVRHKPAASEAQIEAALKERKASFKNEQGLKAWLDANGMTAADLRADTAKSLQVDALITKLVGVKKPSDADVQAEVKANPDKWGSPESVRARQIFIKLSPGASEVEKNEIRRRVVGIYERVMSADKKAFSEAAAKFNEGPATDGKGLLGEIRRGRMNRAWDDAVFAANNGEVVGPIQTPFGYHIVFVEQKIAPQPVKMGNVSGVVKEQLVARFRKDAYRELLKKLYVEAEVQIHEPGVTLDAERFASGEG